MNHKQKIGYTILGAFIMLIGMLINNLTSPVTAQSDGEITCQKLTFVNETGKPLFWLEAGNRLSIFKADVYNWKSEVFENIEVMRLTCDGMIRNRLSLLNPEGREGVRLGASPYGNDVEIFNPEGGNGVRLDTSRSDNVIRVYNKLATLVKSNDGTTTRVFSEAVGLVSNEAENRVTVYDKGRRVIRPGDISYPRRKAVRLHQTEHGGRVDVFNKQGENRAVMSVNEYGNGAVSTWDKNGYRLR